MQEYVIINNQSCNVEIFRRRPGGIWLFQSYADTDSFHLKSLDYTGTFALLYEQVSFEGGETGSSAE